MYVIQATTPLYLSYYSLQPRDSRIKIEEADLGKATRRTAASILQKFLLTPNFSPALRGGKSDRCSAYSDAGVGVIRTREIRPRWGTSNVRAGPDGSGMYCLSASSL